MISFNQISRWTWALLVAVTLVLGLGGCEGDDGAPGAAGAAGAPGADGTDGADGADGVACWDLNGNGVGDPEEDMNNDGSFNAADCAAASAKVTPLESCAVCHDDGSFADATAFHALDPIEAISNVAFAVALNGVDLEVNFDLADGGVPLTSYDEVLRAYVNNGGTVSDYRDSVTLANNGGGNYTITVAGAASEALVNNRWLFRIQDSVGGFSTYFHADYPDNPFAADGPLLVGGDACEACHGPEGIRQHGSNFIASDGGEPCLTCHGATDGRFGAVASLFQVTHGYHSGVATWEDPVETTDITFPTYINNCSVCHAEEAQLAAANAMSVSAEHCFSCHGSINYWEEHFVEHNLDFHLPFDDTTDCQYCHTPAEGYPEDPADPPGLFLAPGSVAEFHNGHVLENDGILWDGADASLVEGAKFDWQITNVDDDGTNLAISWTAAYDGDGDGTKEPVDPCNATVGAGAPVFFVDNRIRVYRNYAQGEDFILGTSTSGAGQPGSPVNLSVDNTACAGGIATTTIPVEATVAERGRVALNGKPLVVSVADPAETMVARVPTPTFDYLVGIGGPAPDRRNIVDTKKCIGCHVGTLYQHGGDRVDNVNTCLVCHNAAANEQYRRVAMGVDASEAYDGKAGEAFELKTMVHRIHSANWDWNPERGIEEYNPPYLVYRSRGIYAFAPEPPANWEAGGVEGCSDEEIARGERDVFGSDPASSTSCQPHNFHAPTFPRSLNECTACHVEGFGVIPDQTKAMASTTDAGSDTWENQVDDTLQGAAATACITCHADGPTKGHAFQNSWTPQVFPEGRQTIIDAVN